MFKVIYAMEIKPFVEVLTTTGKLHCRTSFVEQLFAEPPLDDLSLVASVNLQTV